MSREFWVISGLELKSWTIEDRVEVVIMGPILGGWGNDNRLELYRPSNAHIDGLHLVL